MAHPADYFPSMKLATLEAALHAQPFRPFVLRVDGQTIPVNHPEQVFLADQKTAAIIDRPERMHIVNVAPFSGLTFVKRTTHRAK